MRCIDSWKLGFFGSSYFIGTIFGCYFISDITDKYGRVKVLKYLMPMSAFIYLLIILYSNSLIIVNVLCAILGFFNS
jgi:MFS family permease